MAEALPPPRLPNLGGLSSLLRGDPRSIVELMAGDAGTAFRSYGRELLALLFESGASFCKRRVVSLRFIEERRGEWSLNVDFVVPDLRGFPFLMADEAQTRMLVPLVTFSKDVLPVANVTIRDEKDDALPLESSRIGQWLAFIVLAAAAEDAGIDCGRDLILLTDPDTLEAERAWRRITQGNRSTTPPGEPAARRNFAAIARLYRRSIPLLLEIKTTEIGVRKIVEICYDGPIRVTREKPERRGSQPLVIAPRAIFGGEAETYHVQLLPPERLTVVDSRVLFAYFRGESSSGKLHDSDQELAGSPSADEELGYEALPGPGRNWGCVEGPAEPMSAHIRCSSDRMPKLIEGRDCTAVFQLYPQWTGLLSQYLWLALINVFFIWAVVVGTHGFLQRSIGDHPEALLLVAGILAGAGISLSLYPKEHLLTSAVLRPWRLLEAAIVALTIVVPATVVSQAHVLSTGHVAEPSWSLAVVEAVVVTATFARLCVISWAPREAETTGASAYEKSGFRLRRLGFPEGRALDDKEIVAREYCDPEWPDKRAKAEEAKTKALAVQAHQYLLENPRRRLLNRGIPPAVRHQHDERGV
jgi:hypothetical protein